MVIALEIAVAAFNGKMPTDAVKNGVRAIPFPARVDDLKRQLFKQIADIGRNVLPRRAIKEAGLFAHHAAPIAVGPAGKNSWNPR